jgi:hypothetical protein
MAPAPHAVKRQHATRAEGIEELEGRGGLSYDLPAAPCNKDNSAQAQGSGWFKRPTVPDNSKSLSS